MRTLVVVLIMAFVLVLLPITADADFTSPELVSGAQQIQFDEADAPVLSANGRYAVFQGTLAGAPGVYRRDLQTGEVQAVAAYEPSPAGAVLSAPDATGPSVSADGRYVAFTTTADLQPAIAPLQQGEPASDQGCPEVYVRDMDSSGAGAYTLASALDGTAEGIAFGGSCGSESSGFTITGAQAAPGVALSADGQQVVFTVLSPSNLAGASTPASQVAVRNLQTQRTTLVSATPEGQPTPGGGAFPSEDSEAHMHATVGPSVQLNYGDQITASTASISADGTTVAWLGTNVPAQVPDASEVQGEMAAKLNFAGRDLLGSEVEPLWRRVADGAGAPTRRLLARAGLDLYFFAASTESDDPILGGSFVGELTPVFAPPVLSADGSTVAVLANAPSPASEPGIRIAAGVRAPNTDAYVVHVEDDPAAEPQVTPVTATPDYAAGGATVGEVKDLAISPDGTRVAFDTTRTQFVLASPTLISPAAAYTNTADTYEANLARGTIQRVTSTYDGANPNGAAGLLSFSGDEQALVFASRASNLFFGDGVPASEVYAAHEAEAATQVAPQLLSQAPAVALPSPDWLLSATATPQRDGSVLVYAELPGAGKLGVRATAQLPEPVKVAAKRAGDAAAKRAGDAAAKRAGDAAAKRARDVSSRGCASKAAKKPNAGPGPQVPSRTLALAGAVAEVPSQVRLRLRVGSAYRSLLTRKGGLYAVLRVTFTAPGHPTLVQSVPVVLRAAAPAKSAKRTVAKRRAHSRRSSPLHSARTRASR